MSKKITRQRQGSKLNVSKMMANAKALEEKESHSATSAEPSNVIDPLAETAAVATGDAAVSSPAPSDADLEKNDIQPEEPSSPKRPAHGDPEEHDGPERVDHVVTEPEGRADEEHDGGARADHVDSADVLHDRTLVDDLVETALAEGVQRNVDDALAASEAPDRYTAGGADDHGIDEEARRLIEEALADAGFQQTAEDGEDDPSDYDDGSEDGDEEEWTEEQLKTFDQLEEEDVLADSDSAGAVRVLDNIVVYETENWMNEQTGKPYNRIRLRQQPPTIKFKQHVSGDETGEYDSEVTLVVTRKLAMQLGTLFDAIVASYDGRPIEDKDKQPVTLESVKKWLSDQWKYEPGKVIVVCVLAALIVVLGVYAKFAVH